MATFHGVCRTGWPEDPQFFKCSICLEYHPIAAQYITKCNHLFCRVCITTWLRDHAKCPLCRTSLSDDSDSDWTDVSDSDEIEDWQIVLNQMLIEQMYRVSQIMAGR